MSDESLPHPDAAAFDAAGCRTMLFQGVRAVGGHGRRTNGVIRTVRARGGGEFSRGRRGGSDNERRDGKRRSEESRVGAPVRPRQADTAARTCPRGRSRPTRTAVPAPEADPVHEHGHGSRTNQARARRERRTNASEARRRPPARNALGTQACEVAPESSRRRGAGARARGARAATCRQWARAMQGDRQTDCRGGRRWLEFLAGLELVQ